MIHDITAIIPVKNEDDVKYLKPLLEELCRQTEKYRLEIIIPILEGFKEVREVAYRLKDKFEYIPPISQTEGVRGVTNARNFGSLAAEGDILVHLDCDNILDNNFLIHQLTTPIIDQEVVMTYSPFLYNTEEGKTEKEKKLIKYNNFLLRFNFIPGVPFAIWRDVYREIELEDKNTMMKFCAKLLYKYPGGIKKLPEMTMVSPRHVLAKAKTHIPQKIKKKE